MEGQLTAYDNVVPPAYRGVRKRKWGKWVSEIREPGKKTRIWLGSYEAPEMAAAAYDVAALHLRGRAAHLNFPELVDSLPRPVSSRPEDVQSAAQQAALRLKIPTRVSDDDDGGECKYSVPVTVGLSPSQLEAINEWPMDSPKNMWMQIAAQEAALMFENSTSSMFFNDDLGFMIESIWDF